jgi:hypothetical protein
LTKLATQLAQNIRVLARPGLTATTLWTNNNCESVNHVLKATVSWKSLKLVELIHKLHNIVAAQYREVKRSFVGLGEYVLVEEFQRFRVPIDVWHGQGEASRERHFRRFMHALKETHVVRSTSGLKVAHPPKSKGKKPCQKKRKPNAKTMSTPKRKRID